MAAVTLTIRGMEDLKRNLRDLGRSQMPFAAALALTGTAKRVKEAEVDEMRRVFDRPTPFTLNALQVVPATKAKLVAEVGTKGAAGQRHFLPVEAKGGGRPNVGIESRLAALSPVPFAAVIPARAAKRDAYGNWSAGERARVLSALQAQGPLQASGRFRSGRGTEYYFGRRGNAVGVWRNRGDDDDLILFFAGSAPRYEARFDFLGVAERIARAAFPDEFRQAFARAMSTAR